jgi:hypothetical protein
MRGLDPPSRYGEAQRFRADSQEGRGLVEIEPGRLVLRHASMDRDGVVGP